MRHYKSPDNSLHAIEPEFEQLLPPGCVAISDEEAAAIIEANMPKPTAEQMRVERDARLAACDWTQLPDAPLTSAQKTAWKEYRQYLRDMTEAVGFPETVVWPVTP